MQQSWLCSSLKSFSTGDGDFDSLSKVITILANETETTVEVDVTDDNTFEGTERFYAVLSSGMALVEIGPNSRAVAVITDDDRKFCLVTWQYLFTTHSYSHLIPKFLHAHTLLTPSIYIND